MSTTVRVLLAEGIERFERAGLSYGHGTANALDEAAWLVLHALGLPLTDLNPNLDRPASAAQARAVRALLARRVRTRKPAAYLTNEAWLGKHRFYVDERVIVPRSYIFELLSSRPPQRGDGPGTNLLAMHWAPDQRRKSGVRGDEPRGVRGDEPRGVRGDEPRGVRGDEPRGVRGDEPRGVRGDEPSTILDLCTGSGCLAILAALAFPRATVDAADLSGDALDVAKRNVADYKLGTRVRLVKSDLFAALEGRTYDLIVSNPPYVKASSMRTLPEEYRKEPAMALASGNDGLDHTRVILAEAGRHLKPGGTLVVEIGRNRRALERVFPRLPFRWPKTSGGAGFVFVLSREELL